MLVEHDSSDAAWQPAVHVGAVASGDTVMKSAADRTRLSLETGAVAFEMEGAGVWDEIPCIVVKGVCDYADSHKQKGWQNFAAAAAAAASKAILERYIRTEKRCAVTFAHGEGGSSPTLVKGVSSKDDDSPFETSKQDEKAKAASGQVFYGPISGEYVIPGTHTTGGTVNFHFGSKC